MKTEEALQLAKELIAGPRAKTYGDKIQNHCNIAKLWTAYLDKEITAHDAAVMMALLKVARTKNHLHVIRPKDIYKGYKI